MQKRESTLRRTIAARGFNECVTYSFIDEDRAALFGGGAEDTRLENPISSEMSHMRPGLLPGLLSAAQRNQARGAADLSLFEIGHGFDGGEPEQQTLQCSGVRVGSSAPRDPFGTRRPVDLFDAKADAEAALAATGALRSAGLSRGAANWWHPGRHGLFRLGPKNLLAVFGELHPRVLERFDIRGPAVGFTLFLDAIPFPRNRAATRPALETSDLQAVERDFAFVLDDKVEAAQLLKAVRGTKEPLIEDVSVFDRFEGAKAEAQLGSGKKSVAIAVRLQPVEKTLTEAQIDAIATKIVSAVKSATGGELRS